MIVSVHLAYWECCLRALRSAACVLVPCHGTLQGRDELAQAVSGLAEVLLQVSVELKYSQALAHSAQLGHIDGCLLDVYGLLVKQLPLCAAMEAFCIGQL